MGEWRGFTGTRQTEHHCSLRRRSTYYIWTLSTKETGFEHRSRHWPPRRRVNLRATPNAAHVAVDYNAASGGHLGPTPTATKGYETILNAYNASPYLGVVRLIIPPPVRFLFLDIGRTSLP
ncbi:hypothetical protein RRF57_008542 [Xylaria bambusicola]|uniref:Uncharacterized protein n=1 Tax=Xylaria bambusicola TaxID=326684 RepID=A0AAN7ZBH5_9PEZI